MTVLVRRRFVQVEGRRVHYRTMGSGPPALFIHSSLTNSAFVIPEMAVVADRYTCFCFDTPAFGLSDPLPLTEVTMADLADATVAAMDAVGLPPCPVFGSHTGAAVALELAFRYPERVTGVMLDGIPVFTTEEAGAAGVAYFAPLVPDPLGGHYSATWTRFRDQSVWFPWFGRHPDCLNDVDMNPPESIHNWTKMFFNAAEHYKPAYMAAWAYGDGAIVAASGLTVPAIITATTTDMLHAHLKRLPPMRPDQEIREVGRSHDVRRALTREAFDRFGSPGEAPDAPSSLGPTAAVARQFIDVGDRQLLLRHAGNHAMPVIVLLHDFPGSSLALEPLINELAVRHFVLAFDLPGSGESAPLGSTDLNAFADMVWHGCDAAGVKQAILHGAGFGSSVAIEMATQLPHRVTALSLSGVLLPDAAERADLRANFAPPAMVENDGSHWYRTWLMLRDSLVYWPWYRTKRDGLRRVPANFEAAHLHHWTFEVVKQLDGYHEAIHAALDHDAAVALAAFDGTVLLWSDPLNALSATYDTRLKAVRPDAALHDIAGLAHLLQPARDAANLRSSRS